MFVSALKSRDVVTFKDRLRSVDVLLLDDLQFINGKGATQEEIFHTLNDLTDSRRQVVFSADRAPSELKGVDERLISRLGSGLVADLKDTTYELRLAILKAKVNSRGVTISPAVQDFLAHKMTSSVRALEGALIRVVAHMDLVGRQITVESCKDVLRDVLRAKDRPVTIEEIQRQVAEHYNIHMSDMYSPRRARAVARPRQVAMYLSKRLTARSLPEIGRKFGGRDHTTVLHAMRKIDALRAEDASFAQDIERLKQILEH